MFLAYCIDSPFENRQMIPDNYAQLLPMTSDRLYTWRCSYNIGYRINAVDFRCCVIMGNASFHINDISACPIPPCIRLPPVQLIPSIWFEVCDNANICFHLLIQYGYGFSLRWAWRCSVWLFHFLSIVFHLPNHFLNTKIAAIGLNMLCKNRIRNLIPSALLMREINWDYDIKIFFRFSLNVITYYYHGFHGCIIHQLKFRIWMSNFISPFDMSMVTS